MTTEVQEQPIPTTQPENGVSHDEDAKEDKKEAKEEVPTTNGKESHAEPEPMETATNGHDATDSKPSESVSELAASVKQRQRKKVERFLPVMPQSEDRTKELVIPKGSGIKLGDLDNVEFRITRTDAEDLKPLHRIIFGSTGKALTVRKNLRAFSGFDFEKGTPQYEKKMESVKRFTAKGIKFVLQLLDLETKGEREELEQRLMDFLMNPQPSGRKSLKEAAKEAMEKKKKSSERKKAVAEKKREKKKAALEKKKAKRDAKKPKSPSKKADGEGKAKKRPAPADESESESEKSESESESESGSESDSSTSSSSSASSKSSSAATPSPSPPKKAKPAPAKKASPVKSPAKKAAKATKAPAQPSKASPTSNNGNKEPTDDELHTIISDFVSGADLETVTMKNVIAHVFSKFPSLDLTSRKPWIKETVKQLVAAAP